jgi:hypothetical protein
VRVENDVSGWHGQPTGSPRDTSCRCGGSFAGGYSSIIWRAQGSPTRFALEPEDIEWNASLVNLDGKTGKRPVPVDRQLSGVLLKNWLRLSTTHA